MSLNVTSNFLTKDRTALTTIMNPKIEEIKEKINEEIKYVNKCFFIIDKLIKENDELDKELDTVEKMLLNYDKVQIYKIRNFLIRRLLAQVKTKREIIIQKINQGVEMELLDKNDK